jgi:hypothetical protein
MSDREYNNWWEVPSNDEWREKPVVLYGLEMLWWWVTWPYRIISRFVWVQRCIRGYGRARSLDAPGGLYSLWRRKENVKDVVWLPRQCDLPPGRLYRDDSYEKEQEMKRVTQDLDHLGQKLYGLLSPDGDGGMSYDPMGIFKKTSGEVPK